MYTQETNSSKGHVHEQAAPGHTKISKSPNYFLLITVIVIIKEWRGSFVFKLICWLLKEICFYQPKKKKKKKKKCIVNLFSGELSHPHACLLADRSSYSTAQEIRMYLYLVYIFMLFA